ncbi:MAG: serine/threonine transporter SstT [Clostridia bacterium]|nr:serine/threonine transporter SstT [Clostridia bacterium]
MKKLYAGWTSISIVERIIGGLVIGIILGMLIPQATGISILGTAFVGSLKAIAPLLVFLLVISSLCHSGKSHGGVIKTVIILYMFSTVLAAIIAVITSFMFPVTLTLAESSSEFSAPGGIGDVIRSLVNNIVANPIESIVKANYVGVLTWAVLIGISLRHAGEATKNVLGDLASGLSDVVTWIINLAPFGILGLVFDTVSNNGLYVFAEYGRLIALLVGTMLFIYFVTNPILVYWCTHKNPYPLIFRCLKKSAITAFFTRSSAANIPVNMEACEEMGLDKDTYSVTIPLGATINMDGAAITITVMTLAAANTLGIAVDIPSAIVLSILSAISACGASGVAGGSLLLIPMACSLFGIPNDIAMQVVGVGFIIGVIQDSVETALNSSSDLILSASAEFRQWRKDGREIKL